jgi:hypothetical protein
MEHKSLDEGKGVTSTPVDQNLILLDHNYYNQKY